jgi:alpha-L-fucosidase
LNIGPSSDGDWDTAAYARLRDIGRWMNINGEAIYNSKPIAPYSSENVFFTQSGDEKKIYAFYMPVPGEPALPAALLIKGPALGDLRRVRLLGSTKSLTWKKQGPGILVHIPPAFRSYRDMPFAAVFEMTR